MVHDFAVGILEIRHDGHLVSEGDGIDLEYDLAEVGLFVIREGAAREHGRADDDRKERQEQFDESLFLFHRYSLVKGKKDGIIPYPIFIPEYYNQ